MTPPHQPNGSTGAASRCPNSNFRITARTVATSSSISPRHILPYMIKSQMAALSGYLNVAGRFRSTKKWPIHANAYDDTTANGSRHGLRRHTATNNQMNKLVLPHKMQPARQRSAVLRHVIGPEITDPLASIAVPSLRLHA